MRNRAGWYGIFVLLVTVLFSACVNPVGELVAEDVLVERAGGRPGVAAIFPARGASAVTTNSVVSVTFTGDMALSAEDVEGLAGLLRVTTADGTDLGGTVSWNADNRTLSLEGAALVRGETLTAELSAEVRNAGGAALAQPERWSFTTNEINPYEIRVNVASVDPALEVSAQRPLYVWGRSISFDAEAGFFFLFGPTRVPDTGGTVYLDLSAAPESDRVVFGLFVDGDNSVATGDDEAMAETFLAPFEDPEDPSFGKLPPFQWAGERFFPNPPVDTMWTFLAGSPAGTVRNEVTEFWGKSDGYLLDLNPSLINDDRQDWAQNSPEYASSNTDAHIAGGGSYEISVTKERNPVLTDTPSESGPIRAVLSTEPQSYSISRYGELWFEFTTGSDAGTLPQVRVESSTVFSRVAVMPAGFPGEPDSLDVLQMAAANGSFNGGTSNGFFYSSTSSTTSDQYNDSYVFNRILPETRYFVQVVAADIRSGFNRPLTGQISIRLVVP